MATVSDGRFLTLLPDRIRAYRLAAGSDNLTDEEETRVKLCAVFERLLSAHLQGWGGRWPAGAWVDGALPGPIDLSEPDAISLSGLIVWCGPGNRWFLDPFACRVDLWDDAESVRAYSLRFGDADKGLRKFTTKSSSKHCYDPPPKAWLFAFDSDPTRAMNL